MMSCGPVTFCPCPNLSSSVKKLHAVEGREETDCGEGRVQEGDEREIEGSISGGGPRSMWRSPVCVDGTCDIVAARQFCEIAAKFGGPRPCQGALGAGSWPGSLARG